MLNRQKKFTNSNSPKGTTLKNIQRNLFRTQIVLIVTLALFLGVAGTIINIHFETEKRDQNLQNIAMTIANSPILTTSSEYKDNNTLSLIVKEYLDSLKDSLEDIDVISVVNNSNIRIYHSNHDLIDTVYDGTIPTFDTASDKYYTTDENGPSGSQRRAYAAIYDEDGNYIGFVMAIMLMKNIQTETLQTFFIFALITVAAVLMELMISSELSAQIKDSLLGYEPDVFSAMYKIRDNILESLDEGIIAIDKSMNIQFINDAAVTMLTNNATPAQSFIGQSIENLCNRKLLSSTLQNGEKEFNIQDSCLNNTDILIDKIPIREDNDIIGAVGILHNRTEYTKLMEDLTGTRYLVDSMRANNHDFTNKLHVILGLIQMGMYDEAVSYIENITFVQRATISKIMNTVSEPSIAALLIGKVARASELNVRFVLREGCQYSHTSLPIPSEVLITIIGNLIDNAFDAMNQNDLTYTETKELLFGIYSRPDAILITADDTGTGISTSDLEHIFENGYSTKGIGRGTGLYQVKNLVENFGGTISVESQVGVGTSFSISFTEQR